MDALKALGSYNVPIQHLELSQMRFLRSANKLATGHIVGRLLNSFDLLSFSIDESRCVNSDTVEQYLQLPIPVLRLDYLYDHAHYDRENDDISNLLDVLLRSAQMKCLPPIKVTGYLHEFLTSSDWSKLKQMPVVEVEASCLNNLIDDAVEYDDIIGSIQPALRYVLEQGSRDLHFHVLDKMKKINITELIIFWYESYFSLPELVAILHRNCQRPTISLTGCGGYVSLDDFMLLFQFQLLKLGLMH